MAEAEASPALFLYFERQALNFFTRQLFLIFDRMIDRMAKANGVRWYGHVIKGNDKSEDDQK